MNIGNITSALLFVAIASVIIFWGGWELIDWLFIDDAIMSSEPITPEIKLIIEDNQVDTIYIYRK
jgi:hypothetical protein